MARSNVIPLRGPGEQPFDLPNNIEAEQAILGAALVDNTVLDACPWLEPGDFYEPVHGRIWGEATQQRLLGRTADAISLRTLFQDDASLKELGGAAYLARLAQAAQTVIRGTEYARLVKRLSRLRELHVIGSEVAERAATDKAEDPATIWADYARRLDALLVDDSRPVAKPFAKVCVDVLHEMEHPAKAWPTGIPALDTSLGGGIREGYVMGIEARPKAFKTGTAHTLLLALAQQGVACAYLAYEMGSSRLAKRILGHLGGFNSGMFKYVDAGTLDVASRAITTAGKLPVWFVDCPGWRFSRMKAAVSQLMLGYGVKAFVLDYWQLVARDDPKENQATFLADVAQWCADHAHQHNTTWIICSQQNRQGESFASDGLAKACDWLGILHKHDDKLALGASMVETLWVDVAFARDSSGDSIGSETGPVLYINPHGPHLAQLPGA